MREFARLFVELDASTSTSAKLSALQRYLAQATDRDAAWAVYFLAGGKPRQSVGSRALREFSIAASKLPEWLFNECYDPVGDLGETSGLLLPPPARSSSGTLADWIEQRILPLRGQPPANVLERLRAYADELDGSERFLLIKLIGGGFRVGVSRLLVTRALALHSGLDPKVVAERMIGYTDSTALPTAERYRALIEHDAAALPVAHPYPFFLAHALQIPVERFEDELGPSQDWLVEWKYDGIRAQLVKRAGRAWLWSRGEELIGDRFPDVLAQLDAVPDGTVLDGELLAWRDNAPQPFALLQRRITRKTVTAKVMRDAPAGFMAYDLLEQDGHDWRDRPQSERRAALEMLARSSGVIVSPEVVAGSWQQLAERREESRARGVEGFMLKHRDARYRVGRTKAVDRANWWKWKIDPYSVDAVLVYAQPGHGRRASLYTDYTFAVWSTAGESRELVPFAKAYSGLTDDEIRAVDALVRRTTVEKFGPVRALEPSQVFEIGFEGIQRSPRHRSGIAVRFPRMLRWRRDKPVAEADTLDSLRALLPPEG